MFLNTAPCNGDLANGHLRPPRRALPGGAITPGEGIGTWCGDRILPTERSPRNNIRAARTFFTGTPPVQMRLPVSARKIVSVGRLGARAFSRTSLFCHAAANSPLRCAPDPTGAPLPFILINPVPFKTSAQVSASRAFYGSTTTHGCQFCAFYHQIRARIA